jgi:hypothetical protein
MPIAPTPVKRLLRTKHAAAYLSMSEWKLRRLIQEAILPFIQDQEGDGPFLLDVRDLDAYIESNKHHAGDSIDWRPNPVALVPASVGGGRDGATAVEWRCSTGNYGESYFDSTSL